MAEANGHDVHERGQIREITDDFAIPVYKRQKSERTLLAGRLGGVQLDGNGTEEEGQANGNHESVEVTSPEDEIDGAGLILQGAAENTLNWVTGGRLAPQIGSEKDNVTEEQFDNNIEIRHPKYEMAKGIRLGVHLGKHENGGFIVRRILEDGLLANKDIRPGDIVTHVGETDVRKMSLADLQKHFWNLHFEIKFTLKILRVSEREDKTDGETDGAPVMQAELIVKVKVTVDDDEIKVETEVEVRSSGYRCESLQEDPFFITVRVGGNPLYLCAERDMTLKAVVLSDRDDPNCHWRQQLCISWDKLPYRLFYNVGTEMTICCNITSGQSSSIVKMSTKREFEEGSIATDLDRVFTGKHVTEGKDTFYLQSVSNPGYYMCLSSNPAHYRCLEMAREEEQPKREFHFEYSQTIKKK